MSAVNVVGIDEVNDMLRDMPAELRLSALTAIRGTLKTVKNKVIRNSFGTGGDQLKVRTGALRRSIHYQSASATQGKVASGSIYSNSIYAPIQEKGGTVTPKRPNGWLTIPLDPNKTNAGVMRDSARTVIDAGGYFLMSKKNNLLIMSPSGVPFFALKKSVDIPARLGMERAAEDEVPTLLSNLSKLVNEGFNKL